MRPFELLMAYAVAGLVVVNVLLFYKRHTDPSRDAGRAVPACTDAGAGPCARAGDATPARP